MNDAWLFHKHWNDGIRVTRVYVRGNERLTLHRKHGSADPWTDAEGKEYEIVGDGYGQPVPVEQEGN